MDNNIFIPKIKLPAKTNDIIEFIYDYYNGFEIECLEFEDYYQIKLDKNSYTYCEDISKGLRFLGISYDDIDSYCIVKNNAALCLSENWLPCAFAEMTARENCNNKSLTILHVDDHRDLMSPFLYCKEGACFDMINGYPVQLNDSSSIRQAVMSGAITIGSMLTAIIYAQTQETQISIFHIKEKITTTSYVFNKGAFQDKLLSDECNRIAIDMQECRNGSGNYMVTSDWEDVVNNIEGKSPCLLHIDMDYFNNRYNASTSWRENKDRHDPSFAQQKQLMNKLFDGIKKVMEKTEIKYVLIGISPSFYPVEYWANGLTYLIYGLENLGVPVKSILADCKMEECL